MGHKREHSCRVKESVMYCVGVGVLGGSVAGYVMPCPERVWFGVRSACQSVQQAEELAGLKAICTAFLCPATLLFSVAHSCSTPSCLPRAVFPNL